MSSNPDWKSQLQEILLQHNATHASRAKLVSFRTQQARRDGLFRMFALLRRLGFQCGPHSLSQRHVAALVRYWTADPSQAAELASRHAAAPPLAAPLSAAYIQQQLSMLRVLAGWIGKPGLVRPAAAYVTEPALVARTLVAARDRSWGGNGVDREQVLETVRAMDAHVGMQLEVLLAFGLRRKEAVMFMPHLAEAPVQALPPAAAAGIPYLAVLKINRGTKGGRLRYTPIRHPWQQQALDSARAFVGGARDHLGQPGLSLKQALDRFNYVLKRCGVTHRLLGVTAHGLRHEFAADLFVELTGLAPAVRAGAPAGVADAGQVREAYLEVARQLGHGRPQIAAAYLGSAPRLSGGSG